jgi:hypothetical protein
VAMGSEKDTRKRVAEFEDIILKARRVQFANDPPVVAETFLKHDPVLSWNLLSLFDVYQKAGVYPVDRLPGFMDRLIDTKLQLHFVTNVLPATQNIVVYLAGFDEKNPLATPNLQLARLSYSQATIGQSRVLWDRLMRLIYFLEEGQDPPGKSVRRRFFRTLPRWSPRWDLLKEWESEIDAYDQAYRTPEYHKGSILKKELLGGGKVDPNSLMSLLTPIMNGMWTLIMTNVQGQPHNIIRIGRNIH